MAKRGRKPKPTALKKLEGNPGKRPLNELEPLPQVTMLRCPNWLEPEAKKEWRRLAPVLIGAGILTGADAVPFAGYTATATASDRIPISPSPERLSQR